MIFVGRKWPDQCGDAQSVILHMLPLSYDIKIVIILYQNLSILNAPVEKFLNELNKNLLIAILAVNKLLVLNKAILKQDWPLD